MKAFRSPLPWLIMGGLLVLGALAWQQRTLQQLRREIREVQAPRTAEVREPSAPPPDRSPASESSSRNPIAVSPMRDPDVERRLKVLETSVSQLAENAGQLMDRALIPPSADKLAEWSATFFDPNADTDKRISALRMLSRNEAFTSQMAQVAAGLLAGSTNSSQTRTLLSALRGIDDPAVKTAMLSFATSTPDERLREQAVQNLQNYVADPHVEVSLWELARSDPSERVRRRAESSLRQIPMTDLRAADLELRALNPSTDIEERLISLRLLGAGKQDISRIAPSLSQAAMEAPDAETRLKYYRAFDDINDPSFMLPLVQGAQDADAEVRRRAMDALVDYRSEPAIAELLRAMAQSDPDAGVREQAARIFRYEQR